MKLSKRSHWKSGLAVLAMFAHGVLWGDCWFLNGNSILAAKTPTGRVRGATSGIQHPRFADSTSGNRSDAGSILNSDAVTSAPTVDPVGAGFYPHIN